MARGVVDLSVSAVARLEAKGSSAVKVEGLEAETPSGLPELLEGQLARRDRDRSDRTWAPGEVIEGHVEMDGDGLELDQPMQRGRARSLGALLGMA